MSDATQLSETEAIQQVIAEGNVMDYADVVNAVQQRFQMNVSSAQVEEVYNELVTKKAQVRPSLRTSIGMSASLPVERTSSTIRHPESVETPIPEAEFVHSKADDFANSDDMAHALRFVKSVRGLSNAKKALQELESIMYR